MHPFRVLSGGCRLEQEPRVTDAAELGADQDGRAGSTPAVQQEDSERTGCPAVQLGQKENSAEAGGEEYEGEDGSGESKTEKINKCLM